MDEKKEYYYKYLTTVHQGDLDKVKFIKYLKSKFFNYQSYKWEPTKYKSFVKRNDLDFNSCYNVLINLKTSNFILKQKGYIEFLNRIEKYNNKVIVDKKIKIDKDNLGEFIKDFNSLRNKYFKVSNEDFFDLIVENFEIEYTRNTLKKYFSEKKFE